jgi:lysophospholipase L1-like esterase
MKKSFPLFFFALVSFSLLAGANSFGQATNQTVNPATVPASRSNSSSWLAHHNKLLQEAKHDRIDLLFLGDSITDFWLRPAPRFGTNIWAKYYAPLNAADFGISGDRTEHVIWRIDQGELDGLHPKVTVLMIGTNNSHDDTPEQIAGGIRVIIDKIQEKCPETKILLLGVFPRNRTNDIPAQIEAPARINAIISKYADGDKIVYLDINDIFLGPDGKVPADIMPDFLHPNEHGYQLWADAMNPTLYRMMGISK